MGNLKHRIPVIPLLWPVQIAVGIICIVLSIFIAFAPQLGQYALLIFAGVGLLILGGERIATGIYSRQIRLASRTINIAIGAGIITWIGFGFLYPALASHWLVVFLGLGLLANGAASIAEALLKKRKDNERSSLSSLCGGIISTAAAIAILAYSQLGMVLLLIIITVALAVNGIQIIATGIANSRRRATDSGPLRSPNLAGRQELPHVIVKANRIWKNGSWFNDEKGRYLLFRGVNFASRSKLPPYLPIASLETKDISQVDLSREIESVKSQLDLLEDLGFNVVRLLISWKAIEPRPNPNLDELLPEGRRYLIYVKEIIEALYARNLYVILDFHQDIAHELFGGDGFPDWAIAISSESQRQEQSADPKDKKWQIKYAINKPVRETLKSFWLNRLTNTEAGIENFPVRTHLEKTIGQTAKFFRSLNDGLGHPAILGIEPFNEPHPVGLPKKLFEERLLLEYYTNVDSEIRRFDPDVFIFLEPRVDWTVSPQEEEKNNLYILGASPFSAKKSFNLGFIKNAVVEKKIASKRISTYLPRNLDSISSFRHNGVLSFHYYDPMAIASSFLRIPESMYTYRREWPYIFAQLVNAAIDRGLIPFLTEFGGDQEAEQVREYLNLQFKEIEANLLNSTCWNYDLYHTEEGKDNWNLENYSLLGSNRTPRNLDIVARPYPMRSSAEPVLLYFDIDSKYAAITLSGKIVDDPTVIYIPFTIHYAPEFTVWATGKKIEWSKENQLLYWYPTKELSHNQIIIGISRNLDGDALPDPIKDLANKVVRMGTFS